MEIPGLTVGGNQDIYSSGKGYLTFVKGKHPQDNNNVSENVEVEESPKVIQSKEACIAALYCKLVFHPFVEHIRKSQYSWNPGNNQ